MNIQTKVSLPAEWSSQDGILLCWPHHSMDWQPILLEVEKAFDEIACYICLDQTLVIIAHNDEHQQQILARLTQINANTDNIKWLIHNNNDTWCRDFGPITVVRDQRTVALDFRFNGWGDKFDAENDNLSNQQLAKDKLLKCELESIDIVLEGGSIDSDGEGTLLTTTQCLLSDKRNPALNKQDIENELSARLGTKRIFWLEHGHLEGDDTDSHVDNLARFCNPNTIAYACCDENDEHYPSLHAMQLELEQLRTSAGEPYNLIPLKIPQASYNDGERLPTSYVNFLITNQYILMPTYNDAEDAINLAKLQAVFSDRKVIGIDCSDIIKQSGSIHCLTMQLPRHTLY
ncbi:MAG: agmatine deiminase family protein [Gammaproteobacteria bacterium]|nr:agmatine deiminase family protein [Gammaproteobacteria bacterium]